MKALKSYTGAALAALYAIAFVATYLDYRHHVGEWFADFGLILIALPFVLTMRFLSGGSYDMTGDDSAKLVAAAIFCCILAFLTGALVEWLVRAAFGRLRRRTPA
jgi:hypothetical protein